VPQRLLLLALTDSTTMQDFRVSDFLDFVGVVLAWRMPLHSSIFVRKVSAFLRVMKRLPPGKRLSAR